MKRRTWLLGAVAGVAGLGVGWGLLPPRGRMGDARSWPAGVSGVAMNGWLKVRPDHSVVLAMPRSEMGQGVHTALAMLVAEELDQPPQSIALAQAAFDKIYGNMAMMVAALPFHPEELQAQPAPVKVRWARWMASKVARELGVQATGGSSTVADAWEPVRLAAATARTLLVQAAARRSGLPVGELALANGWISHADGRRWGIGDLAAEALQHPASEVQLKPASAFRWIGRSTPRTDVPSKVNGSAVFGIDVWIPGQWFAAVRMCPHIGGAVHQVGEPEAGAHSGVVRVIRLRAHAGAPEGVAVVAQTWWQAQQALETLPIEWSQPPGEPVDSEGLEKHLWHALEGGSGHVFHARGDVRALSGEGLQVVQARYAAPHLGHHTMEPMNCTAQVLDGRVRLWMPTQVPVMAAQAAARVAGVDVSAVDIQVTQLGGGFGRRLEVDLAAQATQVALACEGRPVQLLWSRAEDATHDFFRPMQVADLRGVLDASGSLLGLELASAGDAVTPRWVARVMPALSGPVDLPDKTTMEGLYDLPYQVAHQRMTHTATRLPVPVGFWRSVGHSHNAFFSESFVDELAWAAGKDPLQFRLAMLPKESRHRTVLESLAIHARWSEPLPKGGARGCALHESFGSVVGMVVEVNGAAQGGGWHIRRVVCVIDCGQVVNPDTVVQQMEGSVVFGLSAALWGQTRFAGGVASPAHLGPDVVCPFHAAPAVQVHIVPSMRAPSGAGEPGVPPVAPALANALFALRATRHRRLPLGEGFLGRG